MDYSQKGQSRGSDQAFFTAGVGNRPIEQNDSGESLDIASWAPERNRRDIGSKVFESIENYPEQDHDTIMKERFGDLAELTAPVVMPPQPDEPSSTPIFDPKLISTEGDHIGRATLLEIDKVEAKLAQTGDVADFYSSIRGDEHHPGMVRNNLKNSFNREVA